MSSNANIAVLILAAGRSTRMGRPKQLLEWKQTTLIESVISTALEIKNAKVYVVLGAYYDTIKSKIKHLPIEIIYNPNWEMGLGASIAHGIKHIRKNNTFDGVLFTLADQPLISSKDLNDLITKFNCSNKTIVATQYEKNKLGVPVLFDKHHFKELSQLNNDRGASNIIKKNLDQVITANLNHLLTDIDTKSDYVNAKKMLNS